MAFVMTTTNLEGQARRQRVSQRKRREQIQEMKVVELSAALKERGKPSSGRKAALVKRLLQAMEEGEALEGGGEEDAYGSDVGDDEDSVSSGSSGVGGISSVDGEAAMEAARQCEEIILAGQQQGDQNAGLMGVYKLMEGKEVNGRGVWQMAGGWDHFMYYSDDKEWWVGDRENMEAGRDEGWMYVDSAALTPDQVTETWVVSTPDGKTWVNTPEVMARRANLVV
jgi:hypothetical protein